MYFLIPASFVDHMSIVIASAIILKDDFNTEAYVNHFVPTAPLMPVEQVEWGSQHDESHNLSMQSLLN